VIKVLDKTLGRGIRLLQSMKYQNREVNRETILRVTLEIQNRAVIQSVDYAVRNMQSAVVCRDRFELWNYCLNKIQNESPVFLEFGVHTGESINYISSRRKFSGIYGFDSFLGLEEDWAGHTLPKGTFNLDGELPVVSEEVVLVPGWFEDTLPKFIETNPLVRSVELLHMDADTYKPTIFVLNALSKFIKSGTIIIFDEYFGYNNWQSHEFKAFQEFIMKFELNYTYIAFSDMQVAIQIN
jgi:hypothetical protein